jgi:flagellar hook-basal body complex protein FliE
MDAALGRALEMVRHIEPLRMEGQAAAGAALARPEGFQQVFQQAVQHVQASHAQAAQQTESFLNGESRDLHEVALAVQKAGLEFEMMLELRNKVVSAYQEVMRMQI